MFAYEFSRKKALLKQKEYLKKRKQKKQARIHDMEEEREKSKKSWLNFSVSGSYNHISVTRSLKNSK